MEPLATMRGAVPDRAMELIVNVRSLIPKISAAATGSTPVHDPPVHDHLDEAGRSAYISCTDEFRTLLSLHDQESRPT